MVEAFVAEARLLLFLYFFKVCLLSRIELLDDVSRVGDCFFGCFPDFLNLVQLAPNMHIYQIGFFKQFLDSFPP